MAKFAFYDIKCTKFDTETDGKKETVIIDTVNIQITKRVNTRNRCNDNNITTLKK